MVTHRRRRQSSFVVFAVNREMTRFICQTMKVAHAANCFLIATLFALLLGNSSPTSAQTGTADTPSQLPHFTDFEEFRKQMMLYGRLNATLDMQCQLVFAGPSWKTCFVEIGDRATMLHCTSEHSNQLRTYPVGATIRVQCHINSDSNFVQVDKLELIDPNTRLEPMDLTVVNEHAAAKINGLALIRARVREIFLDGERLFLFTWFGYIPHEVEIHDSSITDKDAKVLWNQMIRATGSLTRSNSIFLDALYTIRAMSKEQILDPDLRKEIPDPTTSLKQLDGQVLFTDNRSTLVIKINNTVNRVSSRFAHRVYAGDNVRLYVNPETNTEKGEVITAAILIKRGGGPLPTPVPITEKQLRAENLPSRVQLKAVVLQSQHSMDRNWQLKLDCDGKVVDAIVPATQTLLNIEGFRPNDQVVVTASALKLPNAGSQNPDEGKVLLYLSSINDLTFVRGPWRISPLILIYLTVGAGTILLTAACWNWLLQRQVAARTEKLNAVSTHLRKSYEAIPKAVLVNGIDNRTSGANANFERLFQIAPREGRDVMEILGLVSRKVTDKAAFHEFMQKAKTDPDHPVQTRLQLTDGLQIIDAFSSSIVDQAGKSYGRLWSFEDVTERIRIEGELIHAQKMAIVEQLSGGIAHDFNNLLTIIRSSLTMIEISSDKGKPIAPFSDAAEIAVERAAELTQQLLDFSRRSSLKRKKVDVNLLVQQVFCLVRQSIDAAIDIQVHLLEQPTFVDIDETRVEQILVNMCFNARDAIERPNGFIRLKLEHATNADGAKSVRISVEDNGTGMTQDVASRVFEPFFTTKEVGKGSGLGLAMAQSVVEQLSGTITCQSELGLGTKFEVVFPVVASPSPATRPSRSSVDGEHASLNVLLVDDEELVRKTGKAMLESLGHNVVTAENGNDAITLLEASHDFHAVFLDYAMPGLTGAETYKRIKKDSPELFVTICSGYSINLEKQFANEGLEETPRFLQKPYRIEEMKFVLGQCR